MGSPPTKTPTSPPTSPPTKNPTKTPTDSPTKSPEDGGGARGDPHFLTWTGEKYDFHGICDLVLLQNPGFENGLGMDVHVRTKKTRRWSYVSAVAIRIGTDILEVVAERNKSGYWFNSAKGEEIDVGGSAAGAVATLPVAISGYSITYEEKYNGEQRKYVVDLGGNEKIVVKTWHDMVRLDVVADRENAAGNKNFAGSTGLMGSFESGTRFARDNETVLDNVNAFGQEWQVLPSEAKMFHVVEGPQAPEKCSIPSRSEMRRRMGEGEVSFEDAKAACAGVADAKTDYDLCIFDVMATGDKSVAGAY